MRRWLKIILGFVLLIIGIIGLFTPVLQGILTILAGLSVLSTEFEWAGRLHKKVLDIINRVKEKIKRRRESKP